MSADQLISMPIFAVASTASTFLIMTLASIVILCKLPHNHRHHLKKIPTYCHELCHGTASLATGGGFHRFYVHPKGGGWCSVSGGNTYITASAGYIGTVLSGAILLAKSSDWIEAAVFFGVVALLLALSTLKAGDMHTAAIGATVSAALGLCVILFPHAMITRFLMNFLGVLLVWRGIQALVDLLDLSMRTKNTGSDAEKMAELTDKHPLYWAIVFCCISLVMLLMLLKYVL